MLFRGMDRYGRLLDSVERFSHQDQSSTDSSSSASAVAQVFDDDEMNDAANHLPVLIHSLSLIAPMCVVFVASSLVRKQSSFESVRTVRTFISSSTLTSSSSSDKRMGWWNHSSAWDLLARLRPPVCLRSCFSRLWGFKGPQRSVPHSQR